MIGIKYVSFNETSGYGEAARRYMVGLCNAALPFTWAPMVVGQKWGLGYQPYEGREIESPLSPFCNKPLAYDVVLVHTVPEYFPFWREREPGKRLIGVTVWETDRLPAHWAPLLNSMDQLIVPCEWNRTVFRQHGVTVPIDVVPHIASNATLPVSDRKQCRGAEPEDFCFYTINSWTGRKAIWDTIKAYLAVFTKDDPVTLVIKTTPEDDTRRAWFGRRPSTRRALDRILAMYSKPARVTLVTDTLSDEEMLGLHAAGDCYVSLTRSEGWGLGAFDAAAFGRPVIITGYGGQLDFLPPNFAFLVDYQLIAVKERSGKDSYTSDQRWAKPDLAQASRFMWKVFVDRDAARAKGLALQQYVRVRFHETVVTTALLKDR
ncbi:MAG: glycosyltransferase family 4 protein [Candidatus Riflebacteria bacterium]|nr:glycosyltransferase family 4 protein [Candidatus Riflebacteria bacterium]